MATKAEKPEKPSQVVVASPGVVVAQQPVQGRLQITLNRGRNLKGPELLDKRDCYVAFTYDRVRKESSIKSNTTAPVWDQVFVFDNVSYPPTAQLAISVSYKAEQARDEVLGIATPALSLWTINNTPPHAAWVPLATRQSMYGGELHMSLHWTRVERRYREPFKTLQFAVNKTQPFADLLSGPIDTAIEGTKNLVRSGEQWLRSLHTSHAIVLGLGVAGLLVALSLTVAIPALIFFPITGVLALGGFLTLAALTIFFGPTVLGIIWFVLCTGPVQNKIVEPLIEKLLKFERCRKLLTLD